MRCKEIILGLSLLLGFVVAEMPQDVKNYTETSTKYSLDNYGGGLAATPNQDAHDRETSITG